MKGGCHCGAIRYELLKEPIDADFCHCSDCRRATGAPVSAWMDFASGDISWLSGQPAEYASSEKIRRGFCSGCGASISYRHVDYAQFFTLGVATLDAPELVAPKYHIYTGQQVAWLTLADTLPKHPGARGGD